MPINEKKKKIGPKFFFMWVGKLACRARKPKEKKSKLGIGYCMNSCQASFSLFAALGPSFTKFDYLLTLPHKNVLKESK